MFEDGIDVVIADDDSASLKLLEIYLNMEKGINIVGQATNGKMLIDVVNEKEPTLVIVDINMPELNGFEAIKECIRLQPNLEVIFITGIPDYATKAFDINAIDYILKPLEHERLLLALGKAKEKIFATYQNKREQQIQQYNKNKDGLKKHLMIRTESQYAITLIMLEDIIFIEKEPNGKRVFIHTKEKIYTASDTVSSLLTKLDFRFIQTHRSYIVNVNYIKEIIPSGSVYHIAFKDYSESVNISKNYLQSVVLYIENYMTFNANE
ncbi:LytR/AlgR family response regulator transcription factor [Viridibacillus arvi]|uniref:LytR/AlgR family response regulator transcription factor n=1 Tax=Viridibacillus arvi TaxID=263475 RepID=UPI0034CE5394